MKILVVGGTKTQNIIKGLEKKFKMGGIEFIVVKYIEDIGDIYTRGDYFDRALIIEQCWNRDFEDLNEHNIRLRLNQFAKDEADRGRRGVDYVFLTQTNESASVVFEEILHIKMNSVIVVKKPRYSVNFFASLITCDLRQFPDDIVYKHDINSIRDGEGKRERGSNDKIEDSVNDISDIESIGGIGSIDDYKEEDMNGLLNDLMCGDNGINVSMLGVDGTEDIKIEDGSEDENDYDSSDESVGNEDSDDYDYLDDILVDEDYIDDKDTSGIIPDLNKYQTDDDIEINSDDDSIGDSDVENNGGVSVGDIRSVGSEDGLDTIVLDKSGEVGQFGIHDTEQDIEIESIAYDDSLYSDEQGDNGNGNNNNDEYGNEDNRNSDESSEGDQNKQVKHRRKLGTRRVREESLVIDENIIRNTFDAFASRGNSMVVTGFGGCGTSTIAYNLANTISNIGYNVLLVDFDTYGRTQSYISHNNYNSMEIEGANLLSALNSSSGINTYVSITKPGFRLLSMGIGGSVIDLKNVIKDNKLARFINLARTGHNFVIYDIPFEDAIDYLDNVIFMADNIVITVDTSNWGLTKALLYMCNIEAEDVMDIMFNRGQLLFNRYRGIGRLMGKKVKDIGDITKTMDDKIRELIGQEPAYYFQDMHVCGVINEDARFEEGWFNKVQYSDTQKGYEIFLEILKNIILKR